MFLHRLGGERETSFLLPGPRKKIEFSILYCPKKKKNRITKGRVKRPTIGFGEEEKSLD